MFDLKNVDADLLREQRNALLVSIDDAVDFEPSDDPEESRVIREKQIHMLDGLVNMIDDMLDEIEIGGYPNG